MKGNVPYVIKTISVMSIIIVCVITRNERDLFLPKYYAKRRNIMLKFNEMWNCKPRKQLSIVHKYCYQFKKTSKKFKKKQNPAHRSITYY